MTATPLRKAIALYWAIGTTAGLCLAAVVLWIDIYEVWTGAYINHDFCTTVEGGGGIPMPETDYSCVIRTVYILLVLAFFGGGNLLWTSLFGGTLLGVVLLWRKSKSWRADAAAAIYPHVEDAVPHFFVTMGVYMFAVIAGGAVGQMFPSPLTGLYWPLAWPIHFVPLLLFTAVRYFRRRRRGATPA